MAQLVKNLPAMWETWVRSLGWEGSLEKGRLPTLVFWPGEFHGLYSSWGCKESETTEQLSLSQFFVLRGFPMHYMIFCSIPGLYTLEISSTHFPELGRSAREQIGCPLQYSWASLVAQLVKNLPAMWETWVRSLGWEDSPGEGKGSPLQYSGLENSMDGIAHGVPKSQIELSNFHFQKLKK